MRKLGKIVIPSAIFGAVAAGAAAFSIMMSSIPFFESNPLHAYQDIGGIWTICGGVTEGVKAGDVETLAGCRRRNSEAIDVGLAAVDRCIKSPLNQATRAGFALLAYNIGQSAFCASTAVKLANENQLSAACSQIDRWVYVNGKNCHLKSSRCSGIVKRREIERALCEINL